MHDSDKEYNLSNFSDDIFDKSKPLVNDKIDSGPDKGAPLIVIALREEYFPDKAAYTESGTLEFYDAIFGSLWSGFKNLVGIDSIMQITNESQFSSPCLAILKKDFEKLQKPALAKVVKSIEALVKNFIPFTKIDRELFDMTRDFSVVKDVNDGYFAGGVNVDAQGNVNLLLNETAKKIDFDSINKKLGTDIRLQKLSVNDENVEVLQISLKELDAIWHSPSQEKWRDLRAELDNNHFSEKLKNLKLGKGEIVCENLVRGDVFHVPLDDKYNPNKYFGNKGKYANISSGELVNKSENILGKVCSGISEDLNYNEMTIEYSDKGLSIHVDHDCGMESFLNCYPDLKILSDAFKSMDKECHKALVPDANISHTVAGQVKLNYIVKG